jgi:hypothetical protein
VADRLMRLRISSIKENVGTNLDHEFMNRKLIWITLTVKLCPFHMTSRTSLSLHCRMLTLIGSNMRLNLDSRRLPKTSAMIFAYCATKEQMTRVEAYFRCPSLHHAAIHSATSVSSKYLVAHRLISRQHMDRYSGSNCPRCNLLLTSIERLL